MKLKTKNVIFESSNGKLFEIKQFPGGDCVVFGAEFLLVEQEATLAQLETALKDLQFLVSEMRKLEKPKGNLRGKSSEHDWQSMERMCDG